MDQSALVVEIENEMKEILQISSVILSKLEEINRMTKPDGFHALAMQEGVKFSNTLQKLLAIENTALPEEFMQRLRESNACSNN